MSCGRGMCASLPWTEADLSRRIQAAETEIGTYLLCVVGYSIVRGFVSAAIQVLVVVPPGDFMRCRRIRDLHPERIVHHALIAIHGECDDIVGARRRKLTRVPFEDHPLVCSG